ncbi:hypothetical protein FOMPIDRAFT_1025684 [Fomitopsis schrenkii]|uniref:Transmembrane protein n=1 Tax=Fomitopsis schrenkii TaxID=2126942 RepID=S8DWR6_FOMSC|nr:hypothetical protein FOMPIDRAFT_1025684 [Fomitopsis schrenkii]
MADWKSTTEIENDSVAFSRFMHALLGLYIWEFFTSLPFDWEYISGKRKFRWPMVFYFANRYFLLFALIGIAVALNVTKEVNCQALYTYNQVFGNAAIGLASINLSLRTIAVWSQAKWLILLLVAIILGHWSLLLLGILIKAAWIPGAGCAITNTNNKLLAVTFVYSMCFDFFVLVMTAVKLAFPGVRQNQSRIVQLIFADGLIFFIVAFLANLLATIFMMLNLNAVMSIIANVPAAIASTIVACRVVRRLSNYTTPGVEVYGSSIGSTLAFSRGRTRVPPTVEIPDKKGIESSGVHVQMETFAQISEGIPADPNYLRYDATGRVVKADEESYMGDSPTIAGDDYKRPEY